MWNARCVHKTFQQGLSYILSDCHVFFLRCATQLHPFRLKVFHLRLHGFCHIRAATSTTHLRHRSSAAEDANDVFTIVYVSAPTRGLRLDSPAKTRKIMLPGSNFASLISDMRSWQKRLVNFCEADLNHAWEHPLSL